eukprot:TRINITY_DN1838_c0_g1_i1.p1 TRINITY_DN1838_c0_g1~~TRINITY_DN1838_c0_g1_i1.p1  ORF type:complete len:285 (-),score=12.87 TRINITY_DN1838_c0_g1_i1:183-1037(-)
MNSTWTIQTVPLPEPITPVRLPFFWGMVIRIDRKIDPSKVQEYTRVVRLFGGELSLKLDHMVSHFVIKDCQDSRRFIEEVKKEYPMLRIIEEEVFEGWVQELPLPVQQVQEITHGECLREVLNETRKIAVVLYAGFPSIAPEREPRVYVLTQHKGNLVYGVFADRRVGCELVSDTLSRVVRKVLAGVTFYNTKTELEFLRGTASDSHYLFHKESKVLMVFKKLNPEIVYLESLHYSWVSLSRYWAGRDIMVAHPKLEFQALSNKLDDLTQSIFNNEQVKGFDFS